MTHKFEILTKYIPILMAPIIGVICADRFCEGTLREFFESGCILRWLERLKTIDK